MAAGGGPPSRAFKHDALFYESEQQFVDQVVPFLRAGLEQGEGAAIASTPGHMAALRDALGEEAREVAFFGSEDWYVRPASTLAGWERVLAEAAARGSRRTRVVGEVRFGATEDEWVTWTRYESALNAAFAASPSWVVCPYDVRRLPEPVLEGAWRTHPNVWRPNRRRSRRYVEPRAFLAQVPQPLRRMPGAPVLDLSIGADLAGLRQRVREVAAPRATPDTVEELLLAVTEVAANALRHGSGSRRLSLWVTDDAIVCEISDEGTVTLDPLTGYLPPRPEATDGMGLWLVGQLADELSIQDGPGGTRVRFAVPTRVQAGASVAS